MKLLELSEDNGFTGVTSIHLVILCNRFLVLSVSWGSNGCGSILTFVFTKAILDVISSL